MRSRIILVLLIVAIVIADQWTKQLAREHLLLHPTREYAGGLLSLTYAENEGAFLSFGATLPPRVRIAIFSVGVLIAIGVALFFMLTGRVHGIDAVAVAMIGGGGVGNLIDRLTRHGRVTDFLLMQIGPLRTGVFNVADMAITGGVIWLFASSFRSKKKE